MHLKLARRIAGLTQQQLADRVGVNNSLISRIESNRKRIETVAYGTVVHIAHALNLEPADLFPLEAVPRARRVAPAVPPTEATP